MGTAVLFCTWPIETIQVETPRSSAWAPLFSVASVEVESVRGERNVHIQDVRGLLPTPLTNGDAGWCSLSVALPLHCRGKLSTPRILQGMLLSTCEEQRLINRTATMKILWHGTLFLDAQICAGQCQSLFA